MKKSKLQFKKLNQDSLLTREQLKQVIGGSGSGGSGGCSGNGSGGPCYVLHNGNLVASYLTFEEAHSMVLRCGTGYWFGC